MIVYSDRRRRRDPRAWIAGLRAALRAPAPDAMALLIEAGSLEAGLVDALCPEEDDEPPLARALRAVVLDLAHAVRGSAERGAAEARLASASARLGRIAEGPLPEAVEVTEPEGFAFYALYPEMYAEAARRFLAAARPEHATVIGLRSIGTTLSAVVAAELEAAGVAVLSLALRPRGHPWERELRLGPRPRAALEAGAQGYALVVDEGPGISGTSFAAAAEEAARAGVPDHRIVLFPSWDSDGAGLRSDRARAAWARHPRWVAGFEETHLASGRLAAPWGGGEVADLSGGLWRAGLYAPERYPAVQPQHERRKYRLEREGGPILLKFTGLGERGVRMRARAEAQAAAGLGPPVLGLADGFLAFRLVEGQPVERIGPDVLAAMGRHLAYLAAEPPQGAVRAADLVTMTRANVAEGLGEAAAQGLGWMEDLARAAEARPALAVDGRMLPQEWLRTPGALVKCDGLDHHDDHFWPGTQDIAWDLAGAMVEWEMDAGAREALLEAFEARTGDHGAREVLGFHEAAYLAWRLGYATLAAETLGADADGARMARARDRYAGLLGRLLEARA